MVTFNIAGFLADFTNGRSEISVNSSPRTVGDALNELWQLHIGLRDRVVNEQGQLRTHVNIFVDGENIRRKQLLATPISSRTEITILPSVSGGNIS
jgi:molybdopterin converting factor small subunit